ncbi:hypothetical protein GPJ56_010050 [Histomonas meleagridis]|nr:hypothetical protein GPJ56_010050 [Histomonas meleagridis]
MFPILLALVTSARILEEQCDVRCWINKLNITIDEIYTTFATQILFVNLEFDVFVRNLIINNINLQTISAEFYPDPNKIETGILLTLSLSAYASATVNLVQTAPTHTIDVSGSFAADVTASQIQIGLQFEKDENGLIKTVAEIPDTCVVNLDFSNVQLTIDLGFSFDVGSLASKLIDAFKGQISDLICDNVPELIGTEMTKLFDTINQIIRPAITEGTKPIEIPIGDGMYDLRRSPLINAVRFLLTKLIGTQGPLNLNSLVNRFTNETGAFNLSDLIGFFGVEMPFAFSIPIADLGAVLGLSIDELGFSGMNTWNAFTFFEPLNEYVFDSYTGMDSLGLNLSFTINVTFENSTIIDTQGVSLSEVADLKLLLTENHMEIQLQIASPEGAGVNFTNTQSINIDCLKTLVDSGTGAKYLSFQTSISNINLEASKGDLELDIRTTINNIITLFIENYRSAIPPLLNSLINTYALNFVNTELNNFLNGSSCDANLTDPPYEEFVLWTTMTAIGVGLAIIVIVFVVIVVLEKCGPNSKKELSLSSDVHSSPSNEESDSQHSSPSNDENAPLESNNVKVKESNKDKNAAIKAIDTVITNIRSLEGNAGINEPTSLLLTPKLPLVVRFLMPFLVLMNVALFISSNTGIGASVLIKMTVGEKIVSLPSMFDFGLINSIIEMWDAGAYALGVLIAIMSCAWPYTKLVLMLLIWVLPTKIMSKRRRESALKVLDALGKWSLLDSYVMILMLVAFHFSLEIPKADENAELDGAMVVNLWVYPAYGFVTLMIGTVVSLALSHIMLALVRYVDKSMEEKEEDEKKIPLFKSTDNRITQIVVTVMLVIVLAFVIVGVILMSFSFNFVGLLGWAFTLIPIPNYNEYSVIDLSVQIPDCAEDPNSFGVRFTQILCFIVTIVMPIIHVICLLLLWLLPLKRKFQRTLYKACEVMYAWSCLDVFVISVIAAILEISQFAGFMVGDKCEMIDPIVQQFFSEEEYIKGHENCFSVITVLLDGCYILFVAAILHNVATVVINILARKYLENDNVVNNDEDEEDILKKKMESKMNDELNIEENSAGSENINNVNLEEALENNIEEENTQMQENLL